MLVVADASALLALAACDQVPLLDALFGTVRVPPAVHAEVVVGGRPGAEPLRVYLEGKVALVDAAEYVVAVGGLGRGEVEAMALYRHLSADLLLLDDKRARRIADLNGMQTVGSLGVLLLAKCRSLVPELRPLVARMQDAGIHVSERLKEDVLRRAGEA
jgi:predicted nucleic acid-binding protein